MFSNNCSYIAKFDLITQIYTWALLLVFPVKKQHYAGCFPLLLLAIAILTTAKTLFTNWILTPLQLTEVQT